MNPPRVAWRALVWPVLLVCAASQLWGEPTETTGPTATPEAWTTVYSQSWDTTGDLTLGDLFVLDGEFAPVRDNGNALVRLPGAPLGDFGALFGPRMAAPYAVSIRIHAEASGRRTPEFGLGGQGVRGYRLTVRPSARRLVLLTGEVELVSVPFRWRGGQWTELSLRVEPAGEDTVTVHGTVRQPNAGTEPATLTYTDADPPRAGRPSFWGRPFASRPIDFDDLRVLRPSSHAP
ncbi:MAG: hypothetical protein ACFB20_05645 [Opitutales bacterium]